MANPTSEENHSTPSKGNKGGFTAEQLKNAKVIAQVGNALGVGSQGILIAITTAMMESSLRNVNYGDRDSLGLFQQRSAWGSAQARTDPAQAAKMFFTGGKGGQRGLLDIGNWRQLSVAQAAQKVQVSKSGNYAQFVDTASSVMGTIGQQQAYDFNAGGGVGGQVGTGVWTDGDAKAQAPWQNADGLFRGTPGQGAYSDGVVHDNEQAMQANPAASLADPMSSAMDNLLAMTPGSTSGTSTTQTAGINTPETAGITTQNLTDVLFPGQTQGADGTVSSAQYMNPNMPADAGVKGLRAQFINLAKSQIGVPYKMGGDTWGQALDCSSLIQQALKRMSVNAPRLAYQQANWGKQTSIKNLQAGDLVFWGDSDNHQGNHVAIWLGNNKVLEEPHPGLSARVRTFTGSDSGRPAIGVSLAQYLD